MKLLTLSAVAAIGMYAATANAGDDNKHSSLAGGSSVQLSKLMDADIKSSAGEDLGELEDLLIDPQTGEIKFAILGRGGFLGFGEKRVPVPWKAIQVQSEKQFTLNVDKEKLKTAPTTDKQYSNLQDQGYTVTIYRFFAVPAESGMGGSDVPGSTEQGTGSSSSSSTSNLHHEGDHGTRSSSDTDAGKSADKTERE